MVTSAWSQTARIQILVLFDLPQITNLSEPQFPPRCYCPSRSNSFQDKRSYAHKALRTPPGTGLVPNYIRDDDNEILRLECQNRST